MARPLLLSPLPCPNCTDHRVLWEGEIVTNRGTSLVLCIVCHTTYSVPTSDVRRMKEWPRVSREGKMSEWWEDMNASRLLAEHAETFGWTFKPNNYSNYFERTLPDGNRQVLWHVGRSYPNILMWWQVAEVLDGRFSNHRGYMLLEDAIAAEGRL